jgi:hypothetical protein
VVGKPEGKRSLGSPGRRLEDNIKMDMKNARFEVLTVVKLTMMFWVVSPCGLVG